MDTSSRLGTVSICFSIEFPCNLYYVIFDVKNSSPEKVLPQQQGCVHTKSAFIRQVQDSVVTVSDLFLCSSSENSSHKLCLLPFSPSPPLSLL